MFSLDSPRSPRCFLAVVCFLTMIFRATVLDWFSGTRQRDNWVLKGFLILSHRQRLMWLNSSSHRRNVAAAADALN